MQPVAGVKAKPHCAMPSLPYFGNSAFPWHTTNTVCWRTENPCKGSSTAISHISGNMVQEDRAQNLWRGQPSSKRDTAQKSGHRKVQASTKNHIPTLMPEPLMASGNTSFGYFPRPGLLSWNTDGWFCSTLMAKHFPNCFWVRHSSESSAGASVCSSSQTWSLGAQSQSNWTDKRKKKKETQHLPKNPTKWAVVFLAAGRTSITIHMSKHTTWSQSEREKGRNFYCIQFQFSYTYP